MLSSAVDCQLLIQLGERLRRARSTQGLTTTEAAAKAGISRMTLGAIESGSPSPTMGSYLRVMSALGVSQDLALVASDVSPPSAKRARRRKASLVVSVSSAKHESQDLQSLLLHQEAVRLVKARPELLDRALGVLERWRKSGSSHSQVLWDEWSVILHRRAWRRVLARTGRSQELRQASPLVTVVPAAVRQRILGEVQALKRGVRLDIA